MRSTILNRVAICAVLMFTSYAPIDAAILFKTPQNQTVETRARKVGDKWARTELFFGSLKPDGTSVTEQEFQQFLNEEITPRFPDGLTLLTGLGQFRGSSGQVIQERSMLLILLYPKQTKETNELIEEIREEYKRLFQQESVLRVDGEGRVSF